jgi:hypothetical protein
MGTLIAPTIPARPHWSSHPSPVKHTRHPWKSIFKERSVTIALGILANDGIVVATDTQEGTGYAGGLKTGRNKIRIGMTGAVAGGHQRSMAVTGAGRTGYLEAMMESIHTCLSDAQSSDDCQGSVEKRLCEFYSQHVHPFSYLPEGERPDCAVLAALQHGPRTSLWATDKTTVHECIGYGAVGVGASYANHLLASYSSGSFNVSQVGIVAAYVAYKVKELIEGCGKGTDVVFLKDGRADYLFYRHEIDQLEEMFDQWEGIQRGTLNYVLGIERLPKDYGQRIFRWLKDLRRDLHPYRTKSGS